MVLVRGVRGLGRTEKPTPRGASGTPAVGQRTMPAHCQRCASVYASVGGKKSSTSTYVTLYTRVWPLSGLLRASSYAHNITEGRT